MQPMTADEFNTALAKMLQGLKKDLGAKNVRQNYKGTGSKKHARQLYVTFTNDVMIDLWLEAGVVNLGGCIRTNYGRVQHGDLSPAAVYPLVVEKLRPLAG
jgi:hypothetical protein